MHKHITLLALLAAMQRKEKGFAYFETHAGGGAYDLSASSEVAGGFGRLAAARVQADELRNYLELVAQFRLQRNQPLAYPGSALIAAARLRPQDRALFSEIERAQARGLERELAGYPLMRVEAADGFERLRAWLPPPQRRGLTFIDPPYEDTQQDFDQVIACLVDALQRFATGVFAVWYPIKQQREIRAWQGRIRRAVTADTLAAEMWLYPRDSRIALNGSGLLLVNPPYQLAERMRVWLVELHAHLADPGAGGTSIEKLTSVR
ncbi:MAG TPA: 23S rRNA (adenine(2030)-N(6))-methyltransferase RlmJ [Steroidobacteraceae bacterium]